MEESDFKRGLRSSSPEETEAIAGHFASIIPSDCFVALIGNLGAGKTTFVKALAKALGVPARVKSPSFNICLFYNIPSGGSFVHVDAYRLDSSEQFDALLLDEIAPSPKILCVEWADRISIPSGAYILNFSADGDSRLITLSRKE